MVRIEDKLVSRGVFDVKFTCDLRACKGACCVKGDTGAPLEEEECKILDEIYPEVAPYLSVASRETVEEKGKWVKGTEGFETPLLEGRECAYVVFKEGIALCGIEQAFQDGGTKFHKPVSCHLYPIRINRLGSINVDALNYDQWSICNAACYKGEQLGLPVFRFLKTALIRKYGADFYNNLEEVYAELPQQQR